MKYAILKEIEMNKNLSLTIPGRVKIKAELIIAK